MRSAKFCCLRRPRPSDPCLHLANPPSIRRQKRLRCRSPQHSVARRLLVPVSLRSILIRFPLLEKRPAALLVSREHRDGKWTCSAVRPLAKRILRKSFTVKRWFISLPTAFF